ncbi:unnamed protein product [Linum tenue]|uniref:Secreted protein n=1 Tax=Linum tenue TaxID=586396 RepID=A0AAV0KRK5_9ROSI|nr:unnamed protein product [Linum tenue]
MYRLLMKRRFQCLFLRALCCSSWLQVVRSCTIERSRQEQCQVQFYTSFLSLVQIWCMTEQSLFELRLDSQLQTSKKFQGNVFPCLIIALHNSSYDKISE